jgi:hypothetical protein
MKPRGEDTASAVRGWISDEIKGGPGSRWELGKFFLRYPPELLGYLSAGMAGACENFNRPTLGSTRQQTGGQPHVCSEVLN